MENEIIGNFIPLKASADFLGPAAIETNRYENEIMDQVTRTSVALSRFPKVPATGHPHRYFEETAIGDADFTDPRSITPGVTSSTRVERSAPIKAITKQTNISLFDREVTEQQGQFAEVVAKDINDVISGVTLRAGKAIWTGTDTSLTSPTSLQYCGLLTQITQNSTIAIGASIVDGLKAQVAVMAANQTFDVNQITAIYVTPVLHDYIDREMRASNMQMNEVEVIAGVKTMAIQTAVGKIPIISDKYIPSTTDTSYGYSAPAAGYKNYFAAIISEPAIEMPYISGKSGTPNPRLYELGLTSNLSGQHVGIWFNTLIAKGASYNHSIVVVVRP
jgi:hypothetical protein